MTEKKKPLQRAWHCYNQTVLYLTGQYGVWLDVQEEESLAYLQTVLDVFAF